MLAADLATFAPPALAPHALSPLLDRLEALFLEQGAPGDLAAVEAIRSVGPRPQIAHPSETFDLSAMKSIMADGPHADLVPLLDRLAWRCSGLRDGRIRAEIATKMLTSELIGPTGMIPHATVKVGLFYQSADLHYVTRTHAAEETFVIMAGHAEWSVNGGPLRRLGPGQATYHPSMAPHYSVTGSEPTLAAWRWTGDIRFETYSLTG